MKRMEAQSEFVLCVSLQASDPGIVSTLANLLVILDKYSRI